ncbi:T9SS type A sorting domain-containing protein [Pontibacter harenae]|uniref:T9SS type A sorting domain-containing protein n=1 Tax=Pontibacter harenae TaxID=2894083 RepID=UPI001E3C50C4|nr:T9SS type A sorting domain-containing protein [Pontibacter harenae]MCC9166474.1 T9SS type A sorting domain-containing protein [Pontibacter harenae]
MKQFILTLFTCLTFVFVWAQERQPPVVQTAQAEKEKVLKVEQEGDSISIYPNPNNGIFTVSFTNDEARKAELRIMNVIGNEIFYEVLNKQGAAFTTTVNLNAFAKGLYYVKLETDNYSTVRRVVVK